MHLILEVQLKLCKVHGHSGFFGECLQVDSLERGPALPCHLCGNDPQWPRGTAGGHGADSFTSSFLFI